MQIILFSGVYGCDHNAGFTTVAEKSGFPENRKLFEAVIISSVKADKAGKFNVEKLLSDISLQKKIKQSVLFL